MVIVCPSWVGDTVMATPVLRAMRAALPSANIVVIVRPGLDQVLEGAPWVDEIAVCNMKGVLGPWRLARAIRGRGDSNGSVLLLPNSFRSAVGARLSGVKRRIGYGRDHRGWLLTDKVPRARRGPISAVAYYAHLAEQALGRSIDDRRIELRTTDEEERSADELLRGVAEPFAVLNPGANRADKRWPAERFAAVANELAATNRLSIVITGSPGERTLLSEVIAQARVSIVNVAGRGVTLGSLKAVIRRAALLITNDTGPRHIAAAFGTPAITLFGPTDHRWTTLEGAREHVLMAEPFLPEELTADRHARACAIEKISVGDVLSAARRFLNDQERAKPRAAIAR